MKSFAIAAIGLASMATATSIQINVGMELDQSLPRDEMKANYMKKLAVKESESNFIQETGVK